jgi:predicted DNA-binding protein (UPF0251 family)
MPRRRKTCFIAHRPPAAVFKPAGVPARALNMLALPLDEYEAVRLADYEGLNQEEVAARLGVSRPTVSRILERARHTIARAFVEGHALTIEGGPVAFAPGFGPGRWRGGRGPGGPGRHGHGWRRGG